MSFYVKTIVTRVIRLALCRHRQHQTRETAKCDVSFKPKYLEVVLQRKEIESSK